MRRRLNALTILGLIAVCTGLGHLLTAFLAPPEDWWTPRSLAEGLNESRARVRVLISGTPLADHLETGTLMVVGEGESPRRLTADEVRFRFNNWDRVRASLYFSAIFTASYTTAGGALLVVGLLLMPRLRRSSQPSAP